MFKFKKSYAVSVAILCSFGCLLMNNVYAQTVSYSCGNGQIIGDINNDGKITKDDSEIVGKMDVGTLSAPADICCIDADLDGKLTVNEYFNKSNTASNNFYLDGNNENNNTLIKTISIGNYSTKPDLIPDRIKIMIGYDANKEYTLGVDSAVYEVGSLLNITGISKNSGGDYTVADPANPYKSNLKISKNGTVYLNQDNSTSSGNFVIWGWKPTEAGVYQITLTADSKNEINESDENNNTFTKTITVDNNNPIIQCTDSDNGKDYNTKGYAKGIYTGIDGHHAIFGENGNSYSVSPYDYSIYYDHCVGSNQINEAYCASDGKMSSVGTGCPNGCKDGVCIPADTLKPDLVVSDITFTSQYMIKNEEGVLSVTIENLGSDLTSVAGLTNWYNNFSAQNFKFSTSTPDILSFKSDRELPTSGNPLKIKEAIIFSWNGSFNTSGNLYLHFTVDNGRELDESNENNNTLTKTITINSSSEKDANVPVIDSRIEQMNNAAKNLNENKFDQILAEIKTLKDIIKEQDAQIKYLSKLTQGVQKLSEKVENAINNFITYGVDDNTKRLGAGERAAVMYSYKAAFDKLPETDEELADAIKIANGRWPSITNLNAENKAKEHFQKIYKRTPDMNNGRDNAAVTIMTYGLRQRAENRNMDSERAGIAIFKGIYKKLPETTEDWNIMQAITYSGAAR